MNSYNGPPLVVTRIVENPKAIDSIQRQVELPPLGESMLQTIDNSLKEFSSFLHKYKNLNQNRAKVIPKGY
ncbi:hypothetical protein ACJJIX_17105 [Microbulbifer sp. VAAC004]|uniref:hypothetical protein n=1 Tax=unclassified Microbulbifer TaxID=2619833 RepID=UPI002B2E1083|nr:hypothetical protein QT397_17045 [Microbulbifer sp. MKSA007]